MGLLLKRLGEIKRAKANNLDDNEISIDFDGEIKPFDFNGERYYLAVRDNVLIFDSNMMLIHTLSKEDVVLSELPIIKKAGEVIAKKDETKVKLFVKRNGTFEKLSFYNRFDAEFIMKKLKRVASRPDENIEEIFIEDDGAIVEHYIANHWQRRFTRNIFHRRKESETVMKVISIEDTLESVVSEMINGTIDEIDPERIDKCIEMLKKLKQ